MGETPAPHPDLDEQDDTEAVWIDPTTETEFITSAANAIDAVQAVDTALLPEQYERLKRRVIKRSLRLIDAAIGNLYDEMFNLNGEE